MPWLFEALGVSALLALLIGLWWRRQRQISTAHAEVARKYGGRVVRRSPWSRPYTEFYFGAARITVSVYREPGQGPLERLSTHLHVAWPHPPTWLIIRTKSLWGGFSAWFSSHQVQAGEPWFRQQFRVRAAEWAAVRDLLTPGLQLQLERLRNFGHSPNVAVDISAGILHVRVPGALDQQGELASFVEQALVFHQEALAANSVGIEFAAASSTAPSSPAEAVCQVCGDLVEQELVLCARCRTPHHRGCWHYNGQCAIFGCQETHYTAPQVARPHV